VASFSERHFFSFRHGDGKENRAHQHYNANGQEVLEKEVLAGHRTNAGDYDDMDDLLHDDDHSDKGRLEPHGKGFAQIRG